MTTILQAVSEIINEQKLFTKLKVGSSLYRYRQHEELKIISTAEQICSPKIEYVQTPNRMSPAGISMFYCAFDVRTSECEVVNIQDKEKLYYSIAIFNNIEQLQLIDFTKLPDQPSIFDTKRRNSYYTIRFLHHFVEDLSAPINYNSNNQTEFVPTQIVTEYIRFMMLNKTPVHGIIYPSSKSKNGKCCILFFDHETSLKKLKLVGFPIRYQISNFISP